MIEFMLTVFLGNIFAMAMCILLIGFMFLLRTMLNIWFDTDFMKSIIAWFKKMDEKAKAHARKKEKEIEKQIEEANTILIIDKGEFEDVSE